MSFKELAGMFEDHPDEKPVYNQMDALRAGLRAGIGSNIYAIDHVANKLVDSTLSVEAIDRVVARLIASPRPGHQTTLTRQEFEDCMRQAEAIRKADKKGDKSWGMVDLDYWNDQPDDISKTGLIWHDRITRLANTSVVVRKTSFVERLMDEERRKDEGEKECNFTT